MMELNSYLNTINRSGSSEGGTGFFKALRSSESNTMQGARAYGLSFGGYDSVQSGQGRSELDFSGLRQDVQHPNNEGVIVDLVRTLTRSLTNVIDLVQGVFLGDGASSDTTSADSSLTDSGVRSGRSSPSTGLFGTLGSIVGGVVDKVGMHIPILGWRGI